MLEKDAQHELEAAGWMAIRSAGSHGLVDVLAIKVTVVLLVQCKTNGEMSSADWNVLLHNARNVGALAILASRGKDGIVYERLTDYREERKHARPAVPYPIKGVIDGETY